jgi:outer membrane protein
MFSRISCFFCLLVCCLLGASPQGVAAQDTTRIGFNEAIRIALDQNNDIKRAANQVDQSNATIMAEWMDFGPTFNLQTSGSRDFGRTFSTEQGGFINQTTDVVAVRGQGSITLFDGLGNVASLRQANARGESNTLSLERTRQDIIFEVMDRYITLVESREVLRVQREELDARRQQLRQIQEFVDAGSRPISALYEQEAAVAEQESAVFSAQRDVQLAETRLIQTLQLEPMGRYRFEAPSIGNDSLAVADYDLQRLLAQAMDRRLDLRAAEAEVRAAKHGVRDAKSSYFPSISLSGSYGSNWSNRPAPTEPESFFDLLDERKNGGLSVSMSIPIFQGLRRNAQVEQAQVQAQNARYNMQDQKQQVALQVRQAYLDYENARKQLEATQKRLRSARQAREAAQERFNLGAASIVELTNAQRTFVDAASQRVQARYNFVFQKKLIDYYVGILTPREALFQ